MNFQDLLNTAKTGDLILSTGASFFTKVICEVTGCNWSHGAMFVWGKDVGIDDKAYVWEATSKGIQLNKFDENYKGKVDYFTKLSISFAGKVAWRQIQGQRTQETLSNFKDHIEKYRGVPYESNKLEMLRAVPWIKAIPWLANNKKALEQQYCYECAIAGCQTLGLIDTTFPANYFSNKDLAYGDLPLKEGVVLGSLIEIE